MDNDSKYINAYNLVIRDIAKHINHTIVDNFIEAFSSEGSFPDVFSFEDNKIATIELGMNQSLKLFVWQLLSGLDDEEEQEVLGIINKNFSDSDIKSNQVFINNLRKIAMEDLDSIKDDLPTESDINDAFDKLLD